MIRLYKIALLKSLLLLLYCAKGIIYFYVNHNIYPPGNKWNLQGNIVAAKTVTPDYGLGIGVPSSHGDEADWQLANPDRVARGLHAQFYNFRDKVYKE